RPSHESTPFVAGGGEQLAVGCECKARKPEIVSHDELGPLGPVMLNSFKKPAMRAISKEDGLTETLATSFNFRTHKTIQIPVPRYDDPSISSTLPASCHATPVRPSTARTPSAPNIAHLC
ncbi:Hypothetical predicted protein, partial [Prunus dulcis]